jgi:hypothetical protein
MGKFWAEAKEDLDCSEPSLGGASELPPSVAAAVLGERLKSSSACRRRGDLTRTVGDVPGYLLLFRAQARLLVENSGFSSHLAVDRGSSVNQTLTNASCSHRYRAITTAINPIYCLVSLLKPASWLPYSCCNKVPLAAHPLDDFFQHSGLHRQPRVGNRHLWICRLG